MARPGTRKERLERRLDKEYETALNRDYKKYLERYYNTPNEKKAERLSRDDFAVEFAKYYQQAQARTPDGNIKNIREHKIGERIFEFETSAFSEKQFKSLKKTIEKLRSDISIGNTAAFSGDYEKFWNKTNGLTEDELRHDYSHYYAWILYEVFGGDRDAFEAWVSPEVKYSDI